jgi:hypothetical protein
MDVSALRQRLLDTLMDRVREESFPSPAIMDRIEANFQTREQAEEWAEILLEKVQETRFPSAAILDRFDSVTARLA